MRHLHRPRPRIVTLAISALAAVVLALSPSAALATGKPSRTVEGPPERPGTRSVMFAGNNWDGTATIIDSRTFEVLKTINTIPDREERMQEIATSPDKLAYFLAIRMFVGEGHDQYTDDMFTNHAGTEVYVSRPSFADVVAIDLATNEIIWRYPMEGYRADHMAISPDGERLLVSDSTAKIVHEIATDTGKRTGTFPSGDSPHENAYVHGGETVLHGSIGRVYTPTDRGEVGPADIEPVRDASKGEQFFQVVDADTLEVEKRWEMGEQLAEEGYHNMSSAIRPMAPAPDGRTVYLQVSFHHGFVEFDYQTGEVLRVAYLPVSEEAENTPREQYLLDSAHHGLALNHAATELCAAGTMSDYIAIVDRESFRYTIASRGTKPYWSTTGPFGDRCWVSYSGDDEVAVIDYETAEEIARIPVGDHPQRVRAGVVADDLIEEWTDGSDAPGDRSPDEEARGGPGHASPGGTPLATAVLPTTGGGATTTAAALLGLAVSATVWRRR